MIIMLSKIRKWVFTCQKVHKKCKIWILSKPITFQLHFLSKKWSKNCIRKINMKCMNNQGQNQPFYLILWQNTAQVQSIHKEKLQVCTHTKTGRWRSSSGFCKKLVKLFPWTDQMLGCRGSKNKGIVLLPIGMVGSQKWAHILINGCKTRIGHMYFSKVVRLI